MEKVYELFANIFAKEPTVELLKAFQLEENKKLFKSYGINPISDIEHLALDKQQELLAVEYTRLFLVPKSPSPLRESLQRGEGRLWGESTVEVNKMYKKFGFELDDNFKDTPDHLSAELSFLAELYKLESEYEKNELIEARKGVDEVRKYFLNEHLLKWFPRFKDEVDKHAQLAYYRETSRFLGMALNKEVNNHV